MKLAKSPMKVAIRADASVTVGIGHIMRCLTLGEELCRCGAQITFYCMADEGNLVDFIRHAGYECVVLDAVDAVLPGSGEWLVVDHYQLDYEWEKQMKNRFDKIFVIDDLANRRHNCDILLDQNLFTESEKRYSQLVPHTCRLFLGPRYALLRKEFWIAKQRLRRSYSSVNTILVSFGGTDPTGETRRFLSWWNEQDRNIFKQKLIVVIGQHCLDKEMILQLEQRMTNVEVHVQTERMAELISIADVGVGAGGVSIWERCYLGLPTAVVVVADNQRLVSKEAAASGVILLLAEGDASFQGFQGLIMDQGLRERMACEMQALFPKPDEYAVTCLAKAMEAQINDR